MGGGLIKPRHLAPGLWRLGCHHSAVFLLRGPGGAALVEAGIGIAAPLVLAQLDELGVPRAEVAALVLSHGHSDHLGGLPHLLGALPRARVWATPQSLEPLTKPATLARLAKDDAYANGAIARREGLANHGFVTLEQGRAVGRPLIISPGQTLEPVGVPLVALDGDGHAPGGLAFWLPEQGALFSGDSAGFSTAAGPAFPLYFVSYSRYMDQLAAMTALGPGLVCPAHQQVWQGAEARRYLALAAGRMADAAGVIRRRIAAGEGEAELAAWLMERYYRDELTVFTPENIAYCCRLLVKRSLEAA